MLQGVHEEDIKKILEYKDQIVLSRKLGEIRRDVPLVWLQLDDLKINNDYQSRASEYLMQFGFKSLVKRMENGLSDIKENKKPKQGKLI